MRMALQQPDPAALAADLAWRSAPGHRLLGWQDPDYPALLRRSPNPPPLLFVAGDAGLLWHPQVAIVGSRRPSAGGRERAHRFAEAFARAGWAVTSGLAEGIDAAAHAGAMAAGQLDPSFSHNDWAFAHSSGRLSYAFPPAVQQIEQQLKAAKENAIQQGTATEKRGKPFWTIRPPKAQDLPF